jgi:AraC-like DNA-binding protein
LQHALRVRLPEVAPVRYGGDGAACVLVCGWFAYERGVPNPVLASLPPLFRVPVGRRPAGAWIEQSIRHALQEAAAGQPGSSAVAARVAESLFVETLRGYLDELPPQQGGWFAGLRDPQVGRCVSLMHGQPAHPWSVESLAQEVHLSRSVLAERFSDLLGTPPMQYLKRLRLALAARMLCSERSNLTRVAEAVGYESESSFSRAFKAEYGASPGMWRSNGRAGGPHGEVTAARDRRPGDQGAGKGGLS